LLAYFISREVLIAANLIFTHGVSNSDEYKVPLFLGLDSQYFNIVLFITYRSHLLLHLNQNR
jgi:hypothetical protein